MYAALFGLVSSFMYILKFFFHKFYNYVTFNWKLSGTLQFTFFLTSVFFDWGSSFLQSCYYSFTFYQVDSLVLNLITLVGWR